MGTGDYKVGELEAQDAVLKDLDIGTHFLECTTAGTIAIPSRQSHGCWEFDVYKGADRNDVRIFPIMTTQDDSGNGYRARFISTEAVQFSVVNSGSAVQLLSTAASYIDINTWYRLKVARLQSEGVFKDIETLQVSDLVNRDVLGYQQFTDASRYSFHAISDGVDAYQICGSADEIDIVTTTKYLIEFNAKLNSGTAPEYTFREALGGANLSNNITLINGRNSGILTTTGTTTGVLQFYNSGDVSDFTVSGLTIRRIYDADSFAVFIKGGDFGDIYNLVDTTGGSGTNPVVDATYTTSEYLVADLDAGDKITNLKFKNGVYQ